ncbi:uncharacterized protein BKCO1_16000169 [Diplodia corticola]|uniref:Uncharacterized protein n=1 Tax=Diplodia corticola TaxID=236234 RepID=A0A1J9R4Y6_9PEZI|nr:uncharacterized protein BKCO1_16000169 [Diplodia corticola]OJD35656.1 hypothetical protein BKCO1_16000169 [Diplodia corticola]
MSDSEKCFTFLRDNIPTWLEDLQRIATKIEEKQDEIAKVPVVHKVVKKTGSTETLKEGKEALLEQDGTDAASPAPAQPHIPNQAERQALANANRKRKTASVLSKASGPNKYRTRSMIVVYYDAEVQKAFETLVRNIGMGRNMLRKGKMAARMEAMSAETQDSDDDQNSDDFDPILAKLQFRPRAGLGGFRTTRGMGPGGFNSDAGSEAFDAADKALENAQSLCERGAHQSLRDGDCWTELEGARKSFDEVVKVAEAEVAKQKEKAEKAADKARQREEQRQTQSKPDLMDTDSKLMPAAAPVSINGMNGGFKTDTIEVDDNPSDDEEFIMPTLPRNIRLTSRG